MPRITPATGSTVKIEALEDDEAYKGTLHKPKDGWYSKGSAEYGGEDRLTVDWEISELETIRDWISLRLGKQQNGTVSKLRMLLNALSDKPRDTEIKWFDSDTLEWSYDGEKPFNKITEGVEVLFRGVKGKKADGTTDKFTIQRYATTKKGSSADSTSAKNRAMGKVLPRDNSEEPPF